MKLTKAYQLQREANLILEDKITVVEIDSDNAQLNIRDLEFPDSNKAALYLRHIAMTELPENHVGLVG